MLTARLTVSHSWWKKINSKNTIQKSLRHKGNLLTLLLSCWVELAKKVFICNSYRKNILSNWLCSCEKLNVRLKDRLSCKSNTRFILYSDSSADSFPLLMEENYLKEYNPKFSWNFSAKGICCIVWLYSVSSISESLPKYLNTNLLDF